MSARDVGLVLNHSRASGTDKVVLLAIAWHMSETHQEGAWPSIKRLAMYAQVSERTVTRSIANLEELGELDVDRHSGRSYGGARTNRYWTLVDCPDDCDRSTWHRPLSELEPTIRLVDNSDTPAILDFNR